MVPYAVLGDSLMDPVARTFVQFYEVNQIIPWITVGGNIAMSLHLLLEAILVMNPVYLHLECTFKVNKT